MGYLYRPKLRSGKQARIWWVKYYVNGGPIRESTGEDRTFVNAWLVEHGYAQVTTIPPNVKHQELFLKLQREAREERRGLWR